MQQIERGIYFEDAYLGVTLGALVYSHGIIMIDAPLRAEDARSWRSILMNQRGGSNRILVSLDSHPDRTLGTRALDCTIIAHAKTAQVFRNRPTIFKGQSVETGSVWETYNEAIGMRWAAPDITFTEHMSLFWGGPEIILEHHPGPTPGSVWISIPGARVIFVGDAVVINQPPFLAHAEMDAWIESLNILLARSQDSTIVSGRGGIATTEDIRSQLQFMMRFKEKTDQFNRAEAWPEKMQKIVQELLTRFDFSGEMRSIYSARLEYGLHQCLARRFRISSLLGQNEVEEEPE